MNNVARRVYVVVGIIMAAYCVGWLVKAAAEPPAIEKPDWSVEDMPRQLGNWQGEDNELDPTIAIATNAYALANRIYHDDKGHAISVHSAMFEDPAEGVYHSPLNCYRANGWTKKSEKTENIEVTDDLTIPVSFTTWEKDNQKIIVAYWYQLGQFILYNRFDLGISIHWKMRGQPTWPVLVKVMLQIPITAESDESKETITKFGKILSQWLNSPVHRQYLDRWGDV
jgi:EpsI family protein